MKILCVSDIVDRVVYSTNAKKRYGDVDLIICAGDLPMNFLEFLSSTINKIVLFIFGNHNLKYYDEYGANRKRLHAGLCYVDRCITHTHGLLIGGLGGSMQYNGGRNQYTEWQMVMRIISMIPRMIWNLIVHGRYIDILITHSPPYGINDLSDPCHRGFRCFLWFMRKFRPRYLLHGHVHRYDINSAHIQKYHHTEVINVYAHYILEVSPHV